MSDAATPMLFDDAAAIAAADRRAAADIAAGRLVDHDVVANWLLAWGRDRPLSDRPLSDRS